MTFPLTVGDLREHVNSPLGDVALQRLLDDAAAAIVQRAGASGDSTQIAGGGYRFIVLHRPAVSITSVSERYGLVDTILNADDYLLQPGGYMLERLTNGTTPRGYFWAPRVTVVYATADNDAVRIGCQIDLVKLQLSYNPGLSSESIGTWTEYYANSSAWNNDDERESILCRLDAEPGMMIVGNPGWSPG